MSGKKLGITQVLRENGEKQRSAADEIDELWQEVTDATPDGITEHNAAQVGGRLQKIHEVLTKVGEGILSQIATVKEEIQLQLTTAERKLPKDDSEKADENEDSRSPIEKLMTIEDIYKTEDVKEFNPEQEFGPDDIRTTRVDNTEEDFSEFDDATTHKLPDITGTDVDVKEYVTVAGLLSVDGDSEPQEMAIRVYAPTSPHSKKCELVFKCRLAHLWQEEMGSEGLAHDLFKIINGRVTYSGGSQATLARHLRDQQQSIEHEVVAIPMALVSTGGELKYALPEGFIEHFGAGEETDIATPL